MQMIQAWRELLFNFKEGAAIRWLNFQGGSATRK